MISLKSQRLINEYLLFRIIGLRVHHIVCTCHRVSDLTTGLAAIDIPSIRIILVNTTVYSKQAVNYQRSNLL